LLFLIVLLNSKKIDTKSNKKVLKELCSNFRFSFEKFESVIDNINRTVTFRNKIAHGEKSYLSDTNSIDKYISSLTEATDIFFRGIEMFLSNESYLQNAS
jgi:hypothetical protein